MGGGTRPPNSLVVALLLVCWLSYTGAGGITFNCDQDSDCQDFAVCLFDCFCQDGFTENITTGECEVSSPCTTGKYCDEACAKVSGNDTCFCRHGQVLSGEDCQTKETVFIRFDLSRTFDPVDEDEFFSEIGLQLKQQFDDVYLEQDNITGVTYISASGGSRTVVIFEVNFADFDHYDTYALTRSFSYFVSSDYPIINVTNEEVPVHDVGVYDTLQDAVDWTNEQDLEVCNGISYLCNYTTHSCLNLKGLSYACDPISYYSSKYYLRGVVNRPYNESEVDELVAAFVNLTNEFLHAVSVYPELPVEELGYWPTDSKLGTVVITTIVASLPYDFEEAFFDFFWSSDVEISVNGVLTRVDEINLFNYAPYAVNNTEETGAVMLCYSKLNDCPPSVNCRDFNNGTFICEPVTDYSQISNGTWRALVSATFSEGTAENISIATAAEIQRILRDEMLQGPINVTVADFGIENGTTYVVVEIGFAYSSHYSQAEFIYESFILKNQTVTVMNADLTFSDYEFVYVKFYNSLEHALAGGTGEEIFPPCNYDEHYCYEDRRCLATDFRPICYPVCNAGFYSDGENCQSCGPNMTTFHNETTRQRYCILKCPQNESYNTFSKQCEACPEDYFSPEDDPRCYACHDSIADRQPCYYYDDYTRSHWMDEEAKDIRIKLTALYHQPCHFMDFADWDIAERNLSLFFGSFFKYRQSFTENIKGLCLLDYDVDTSLFCENMIVELESDVCQPDPSCSSDCDIYATNLTITVYNTLSQHVVDSYNGRATYALSAESSLKEVLFDTSRATPIYLDAGLSHYLQVMINFTLREAPEVMTLTLEDAQARNLYVSTFSRDQSDVVTDYLSFKEEVSTRLRALFPDFLYVQLEAYLGYGYSPWQLSFVFKDGVNEEKINATAEMLLDFRDEEGNSSHNLTTFVGPIAIYTSKDDAENIIDWCDVKENIGQPLQCIYPEKCHNFEHFDRHEELVHCDSPYTLELYAEWVIDKPYNQSDTEEVEETIAIWVEYEFHYGPVPANVTGVVVNATADNLTSITMQLQFYNPITDDDEITLSEFIYDTYLVQTAQITFPNSDVYQLIQVKLYESRMDIYTGNPLDLRLCNSTNEYCGDLDCYDTPYGPYCFGVCGIGYYSNGTECIECPHNTTTMTVEAHSVDDCIRILVCDLGYYSNGTDCIECPHNTTTTTNGAESVADCISHEMVVCEIGYYRSGSGCTKCPNDTTTMTDGAESAADCILVCDIGYYSNGTDCIECPHNTTTTTYGAESVADCISHEMVVCEIGYYRSGSGCTKCPNDTTTMSDGAESAADCISHEMAERTFFIRFALSRTFDPDDEEDFYSEIGQGLDEMFDNGVLQLGNITGEAYQSASGGSRTVVVFEVVFKDFDEYDKYNLVSTFSYFVKSDPPFINMTNEDVPVHDVAVYDTLQDALDMTDELDLEVCYNLPDLCNFTTHSCQNLKGLDFKCVYESYINGKSFIRTVVNRPYDDNEVDEIVSAIVNLTNHFLDIIDVDPEFPVEELGYWPSDSKQETIVITTIVATLPYDYTEHFVELFWISDVEISVQGVTATVDSIQMFTYGDYAVMNIHSVDIGLCYTQFSDCPPGVSCMDYYNGTHECEPVTDYSQVFNGTWRALVSAPFSEETAENISIATATEIQRILRDEMLQGPINVSVVDFGMENGTTYVVVDIGFSYHSHYHQGEYIYESFILKNPTVTVMNEDSSYSDYEFVYVKYYYSQTAALAGGRGEDIYAACYGIHLYCDEDETCFATDFIPECHPFCFVGYYSDGEDCQSCGINMTTFHDGTVRQRYCISECPQNNSYNIFHEECEPCPDYYFSPKDDPRCYACHNDLDDRPDCDYWDGYGAKEWISGHAEDIRLKLTAVYHEPCHFHDFYEETVAQTNLSEYFGNLFKYRRDYSDYILGLCLLDYNSDTYSYCENMIVEIESDFCISDPSCSGDCDTFATNLTVTIYNTLPEHLTVSYRDRPIYGQSSVSSLMEVLFDTSRSKPVEVGHGIEVMLNFTLREEPEVMPLSLEDAQNRHLYVSAFKQHGYDPSNAYIRFKNEVSDRLRAMVPDFLFLQSESSMGYGDYSSLFSVVFEEGVNEEKIDATAHVLLSMRTELRNDTHNMTLLVGPIAIHTSKEDTENIVDWCAVMEEMGQPLNCSETEECRNFDYFGRYEDLVRCDSSDRSELYMRLVIDKPYDADDDDEVEEEMEYWLQHQFMYQGFTVNVSGVDVSETSGYFTNVILHLQFPSPLTDSDEIAMSEFVYEEYILGNATVSFPNSTYFYLLLVEVYDSKTHSLAEKDPLDLPLCNSTNRYCGDNDCFDTPYGPHCLSKCYMDYYSNGQDCAPCPVNTTTITWGAESVHDCVDVCGLNEGFDFLPWDCEPCLPGLESSADQQFCFFPNSSDVNKVDLSVDVNVTVNNCEFLDDLDSHEFLYGATHLLKEIFSNHDNDYLLSEFCYPEYECSNLILHIEENEENEPLCIPSPSCSDLDDCEEYHMFFSIDIFGVDDKIWVRNYDSMRRGVSDVIFEILIFARQRTDEPGFLIENDLKFDHHSIVIHSKTAEERSVYVTVHLNIPFEEDYRNESSYALMELNDRLGDAADEIFSYVFTHIGYLHSEFEEISEATTSYGQQVEYTSVISFSQPIDDEIIFILASVMISSHENTEGVFGSSNISFVDSMYIFRNRSDAEEGKSALDWCEFLDFIGHPLCGLEECVPKDGFLTCEKRNCSADTGFDFITCDCEDCEPPSTSQNSDLFCHFSDADEVNLVDVKIEIEGSTNNHYILDELNADDYVRDTTNFVRSLFIVKEYFGELSGICQPEGLCLNVEIDVKQDDGEIIWKPGPSCDEVEDLYHCHEYKLYFTFTAYNVKDKVEIDNSTRPVEQAILQVLHLMFWYTDHDIKRSLITYHSHYDTKSAKINITESVEEKLYITVILDEEFTEELRNGSSPEYQHILSQMFNNAFGIFYYFLHDYGFSHPAFEALSEYDLDEGTFVMFNASLVFNREVTDEVVFLVASVMVSSHNQSGGRFGDTGYSFVDKLHIFYSLEDAAAGVSALNWCSFFDNFGYQICEFDECEPVDAFLECTERTCGVEEGFDLVQKTCSACQASMNSTADELFCFCPTDEEASLVNLEISVQVGISDCSIIQNISAYDYNIGTTYFVRSLLLYRDDDYILEGLCHSEETCDNVYAEAASVDNRVICKPAPRCEDSDWQKCYHYLLNFTIKIYAVPDKVQVLSTDSKKRHVVDAVTEALYFSFQHVDPPTRYSIVATQTHFVLSSLTFKMEDANITSRNVYVTVNLNVPYHSDFSNPSTQHFNELENEIKPAAEQTLKEVLGEVYESLEATGIDEHQIGISSVLRINLTITVTDHPSIDAIDAISLALLTAHEEYDGSLYNSSVSLVDEIYVYERPEDIELRISAQDWCKLFYEHHIDVCYGRGNCEDTELFFECDDNIPTCDIGFYYNGTNCTACGNGETTFAPGAVLSDDCIDQCLMDEGFSFQAVPPQCQNCPSAQSSTAVQQFCYYSSTQDAHYMDIFVDLDFTIPNCSYIIPSPENPDLDPDKEASDYVREILRDNYRGFCAGHYCSNILVFLHRDADDNFICTSNCGSLPDSECHEYSLAYSILACNVLDKVWTEDAVAKQRDAVEVLLQTLYFLRHPNETYEEDPGVPKAIFPPIGVLSEYVSFAARRAIAIVNIEIEYPDSELEITEMDEVYQEIVEAFGELFLFAYAELLDHSPFSQDGKEYITIELALFFKQNITKDLADDIAEIIAQSHDHHGGTFGNFDAPLIGPVALYVTDDYDEILQIYEWCPHFETLCEAGEVCQQKDFFIECIPEVVFVNSTQRDFYPWGASAGDKCVINDNYEYIYENFGTISEPIIFDEPVPFGHSPFKVAHVLLNGAVTIGTRKIWAWYPDLYYAHHSGQTLLAPFWSLTNPEPGLKAYYQLYQETVDVPGQDETLKYEVMTRASQEVREYEDNDFNATLVLVVTWEDIKPFSWYTIDCIHYQEEGEEIDYCQESQETATFQVVFTSDGYTSYALVTFKEGAQNWNYVPYRPLTVGHVTPSGFTDLGVQYSPLAVRLDTLIGNTGRRGTWIDKVGEMDNPITACNRFFQANKHLINDTEFQEDLGGILRCPCNMGQLGRQWWFVDWTDDSNNDSSVVICYALSPIAMRTPRLRNNSLNNYCCYRFIFPSWDAPWWEWERAWLNASHLDFLDPYGSHILTHSPWRWISDPRLYQLEDIEPRRTCCSFADVDSCLKYNRVRPSLRCTTEVEFLAGMALGDPHIKTLDGHDYTFNGLGEYILYHVEENDTNFMFQGRTQRALDSDGNETDATVFMAFAAQDGSDAHFQVMFKGPREMRISVNGISGIEHEFDRDENYQELFNSMELSRDNSNNRTSAVASFASAISLTVFATETNLEFSINVHRDYSGLGKGLLGNMNGDPTDDFIIPNGDILPSDQTDTQRDIFYNFGERWEVTNETTIFTYGYGQGPETFKDDDFEPFFIEDAPLENLTNAKLFCDNDTACVFDYLVTRDESFATSSKTSNEQADSVQVIIANEVPTLSVDETDLNEAGRWIVYQGETSTISYIATDPEDEAITFELAESFEGLDIDSTSGEVTFLPQKDTSLRIGVRARDAQNGLSQIEYVVIVICTNCSNHGECDPTDFREQRESGRFLIASCICDIRYAGDDCEEDYNACDDGPCAEGQNCTDLTPEQQQNSTIGFECGPCPDGYLQQGIRCSDINECLNTTHPVCPPEATCHNTEGSYECQCNAGYKSIGNDQCEDIDECADRQHDCEQVCINDIGGYNCSCESGSVLNVDGFTCDLDPLNTDLCNTASCEQVCVVNDGVASCSCRAGYQVDPDDTNACVDIDECSSGGSCSQECINEDGGFSCSCFLGYFLEDDSITCSQCAVPYYGEGCENLCLCNGQGSCDHAVGCVCIDGWTGEHCDVNVNECLEDNPCASEQICRDTRGSYECDCPEGFEKEDGECEDFDECADIRTHACSLLLEDCVNTIGSYTCNCQEGYARDSNGVCADIDECETGSHNCEQLCENNEGTFSCLCHSGFDLNGDARTCQKVEDVCARSDLNCDTECTVDDSNEAYCICNPGFTLFGNETCVDINECSIERLNLCGEPESCNNTEGGYTCSCSPGSQLDNDGRSCVPCGEGKWGDECKNDCSCSRDGAAQCAASSGCICNSGFRGVLCEEDIDECTTGLLTCPEGKECINERGNASCHCLEGYEEDLSGSCIDIDECSENNGLCQHICVNTPGGHSCACSDGYYFNTTTETCEDVDECGLKTAGCEDDCVNTNGGFRCACSDGLRLSSDGVSCIVTSECTNKTCEDRCAVVERVETCFCPRGKEVHAVNDSICSDVDLCEDHPCSETCEETADETSFICTCPSGMEIGSDGINCEECPDGSWGIECNRTCECYGPNTESCHKETGSCDCVDGYEGDTCASDIDECTGGAICPSDSSCENIPGSYVCKCNIGYYQNNDTCVECEDTRYGEECNSICSCNPTTSTCNNINGSCLCDSGWTGTNCDEDFPECDDPNNECAALNRSNLVCVELTGSFDCRCEDGYTDDGGVCSDVDECNSAITNLCSHNCANTDGSFTCSCNTGYEVSALDPHECDEINECERNLDDCQQECFDEVGGYTCGCFDSYEIDPSNSSACYFAYPVGFSCTLEYDISSYDLTDPDQYQEVIDLIFGPLLDKLRETVEAIKELIIHHVESGSVVINATTLIDANIESTPASSMVDALILLAETGVIINGTQVPATVVLSGETVTSTTSKCFLLELIEECQSGYFCTLDASGKAFCSEEDSGDDDNLPLIVGLAVGIPALFIIIALVVAVFYLKSKNGKTSRVSSRDGLSNDGYRPPSSSSSLSGPKLAFHTDSPGVNGSKLDDPLSSTDKLNDP